MASRKPKPKTKATKVKANALLPQLTSQPERNLSTSPYGEVSTVLSYLFAAPPYPYNPDDLVGKKGLQIYTKMGRDEQVKTSTTARNFAVISAGGVLEVGDV